jgi:hypothetical protein
MAVPPTIPPADAPDAEVADYFALIARLIAEVKRGRFEGMTPCAGQRPPPERIGPSDTYKELEYLLGYKRPQAYRARPSTPADFDPPRAAGPVT